MWGDPSRTTATRPGECPAQRGRGEAPGDVPEEAGEASPGPARGWATKQDGDREGKADKDAKPVSDGNRGHPAATLRGSLRKALTLHAYFGKNWQGRKIKVYVAIFHSRKPTDLCKAEK